MAAGQDQLTFKYGQPLFAAAWPCTDIILVAGGGGRPGTGIENRIIAGTPAPLLSFKISLLRLYTL